MNTLYQETDNYLLRLQNLLEQQKIHLIKGTTDDNDFELIITEANNQVFQKIDDAIKSISILRQKLRNTAQDKVSHALLNQPQQ